MPQILIVVPVPRIKVGLASKTILQMLSVPSSKYGGTKSGLETG